MSKRISIDVPDEFHKSIKKHAIEYDYESLKVLIFKGLQRIMAEDKSRSDQGSERHEN